MFNNQKRVALSLFSQIKAYHDRIYLTYDTFRGTCSTEQLFLLKDLIARVEHLMAISNERLKSSLNSDQQLELKLNLDHIRDLTSEIDNEIFSTNTEKQ